MSLFRILVIAMLLFTVSEALAEPNTSPLQLQGPVPGGARSTLTESSGRMVFTVLNPGPTARLARVVVHFPESPNEQFSKDVWVPAQASASAAVTVGPAPNQRSEFGRLIQTVLQDRTDGADVVVLPPGTERLRTPSVLYRKREPSTSIVADLPSVEPGAADPGVDPDLLTLARVPRAAGLSEHLFLAADGPSPVDSEAFDGVDVVVIAGNRLKHDAPGRAALRHWVELGGRVWVMLDRVEPDTVAALFGDDGEMALVDRTGLTTVRLRGAGELTDLVRELEQPVPFARVRLSESDRVIVSANEWPAAFVRRLGRGKVVFTTLGVAGWTRPKTARDGSGPFSGLKDFPIPLPQAILLTGELYPSAAADPLPPDTFAAILSEEIGYSVVGRGTAVAILGLFLLGLGGAGYAVRRSRNPVIVALAIPDGPCRPRSPSRGLSNPCPVARNRSSPACTPSIDRRPVRPRSARGMAPYSGSTAQDSMGKREFDAMMTSKRGTSTA